MQCRDRNNSSNQKWNVSQKNILSIGAFESKRMRGIRSVVRMKEETLWYLQLDRFGDQGVAFAPRPRIEFRIFHLSQIRIIHESSHTIAYFQFNCNQYRSFLLKMFYFSIFWKCTVSEMKKWDQNNSVMKF